MNNALVILFQALLDSFRPRMLMLTVLAVSAALLFWLVVIWLAVDPFVSLAMAGLGWMGFDMGIPAGQEFVLLGWFKAVLVPLAVFGLLWPVVASSAVLLAGLYVTPAVLKFLSARDFPHLARQGQGGVVRSVWVTLRAVVIFLVLWAITLPLWLIPGVAFVLPLLLTAQLMISVMRHDALSEHATLQEIKLVQRSDSTSAWLIGVVCAFLSFVPPILLIMPVVSALAFTRHYLQALQQLRLQAAVPQQSIQPGLEFSKSFEQR